MLQKRHDRNGNEFWSVITSVPAQQKDTVNWGPSKPVKSPTLLDPAAATSAVSYYTSLPESLSQASVLGLPNSEWFDVTAPDGERQIRSSTPRIIGNSGRQYTPEQEAMFKQTGREVDELSTREKLQKWVSQKSTVGAHNMPPLLLTRPNPGQATRQR